MVASLLSYVPELYPDETFYSFFARYRRDLRLSHMRACIEIFGKERFVSPSGMQGRLEHAAKRIHPDRGLTVERLIHETTPYNYYASFVSPERARLGFAQLAAGDDRHVAQTLSVARSTIKPPTNLQLCLKCCAEAQDNHSDLYWRRSHQLPGVIVCSTHRTILQKSDLRATGLSPYEPSFALSNSIIHRSSPAIESIEPTALDILYKIAKFSADLCSRPPAQYMPEIVKEGYRGRLRDLGFTHGSLITSARVTSLIAAYLAPIAPFISGLCPDDAIKKKLHILWVEEARSPHPIRHILFQIFLEELEGCETHLLRSDHSFGDGPWPCLNPLADHRGELRITKMVLHEFRDGKAIKAAFHCADCGYRYRRTAASDEVDVIHFGGLFDKRLSELIRSKVSIYGMERLLYATRARIQSRAQELGLSLLRSSTHSRIPLSEAKLKFKARLARDSDANRSEFCSKNRRLIRRLRRDDPEWLEAHLPGPLMPGNKRDWQEADTQLAALIRRRALEQLSQFPRARITARSLLAEDNWRQIGLRSREKLPESWALIDDLSESLEIFHERSLTNAASVMIEQGIPLCKTRMRALARVSPVANPIAEAIIRRHLEA
ncbi:TnsD family Tn7-like transposition protein [Sphingopyxis sp.]|uniref:TnsD family Tn7-like transposition protein n=1 Tax=Sphingopyxis sp. TaxID=1908224 RepID=UPI002D77AF44|nr:TnsD family Tn7-like transposition protein [Sphingopyxis sp.]HET6525172.1 TnsD family Tn7-like transposition protein [Sphingopyxis sp.]